MARRSSSIIEDLCALPWWVSVLFAAIIYIGVTFVLPALLSGHAITANLAKLAEQTGWMLAVLFLVPAPIAAFREYRRKRLLDAQADLSSIRDLTWQEFEALVSEWFRRIGYTVMEKGGSRADGGIDLVATAHHEKILIQCKHWRSRTSSVTASRC